jgi:hypothetical protein
MSTPLEQILELLSVEQEYATDTHAKFKEISAKEAMLSSSSPPQQMNQNQQLAAPSPTASAVVAPSVRGFTKMSQMMLGLQQLNGGISQQSTATRAFPEISGDPALFRFPLIPAETPWDAIKAVEGGRADPFVARLPNFSLSTPGACNTLVIRGEYYTLPGYDRVFVAVNIGEDASSSSATGSSTSSSSSVSGPSALSQSNLLRNEVLAHVSIRIDPSAASKDVGGGGGGGGGLKYRFVQAFKQNGRWDTACAYNKIVNSQSLWPLKERKPFYLRLTIEPRGVFSYLDGKAFGFAPHQPNWSVSNSRNNNLVVQLPVSGDSGEKVTWTVLGMWWGTCSIDSSGENVFRNAALNLSQQKVQVAVSGELFVTGLKDTAREYDLREAFKVWDPIEVRLAEAGSVTGSATVVLKDATRVSECISTTNKKLSVLGSVVSVTQSLKQVPAMQAISSTALGIAPIGGVATGTSDNRSPPLSGGLTSGSALSGGSRGRSPYSM